MKYFSDGFLIINLGEMSHYSFVLTTKTLKCSFKPYTLHSLEGLKLRDSEGEPTPTQHITLVRQDGGNVVLELKELKLICEDANDYRSWYDSFKRVLDGDLEVVSLF